MKKRFRDYLQKGLINFVLAGAAVLAGCGVSDPYYEIFRHDDKKNITPITEPIEINYKEYDKKHDYDVVNDRAYLKQEAKPQFFKEEIVDVPLPIKYRIPAINSTYIEDGNDIILQYKSRLPAKDLLKVLEPYLKEKGINVVTYENQNTLIFDGKKQAFGNFTGLVNKLHIFDLPAKQIRIKLSIVEYFNDNTYDRDLVLNILKNNMNLLHLNLPSMPDPTVDLVTGININPFYSHRPGKYGLEGAIKFLDSYGKARVLSGVDVLASNAETVKFSNTTSIPYPELLEGKTGWVETIKYRDTGTTIQVTPFANDEGFITIKLEKAESGEHTGYYGTFQRPTFRQADLSSGFVIKNGVPYFAAISTFERYKEVERGLPFISQIPILKDIFSSKSIEKSQAQLLYFIEARIIPRISNIGTQIKRAEEVPPPELKEIEEPEKIKEPVEN